MKNNRGFTLVELIVSVALIALILVPVAGFFTNSFRIQGKTSMKTAITRVGQYIIENFKNKNYLSDSGNEIENLTDGLGTDFRSFLEGITLSGNGKEVPYQFSDNDIKNARDWYINYKGVDYDVNIAISDFTPTDFSNLEIPKAHECNAQINASADGTLVSFDTGVSTFAKGSTFIDPIDGNSYTADFPTIILRNNLVVDDNTTLWINNSFYDDVKDRQETIRIIKEFENDLHVYIEGKNVSIRVGQEGDGANADQKRIVSSYVGEEIDENKKSESEILLDAKMIITKSGDDTIRDTFEFSFPVNYDYSKEGE